MLIYLTILLILIVGVATVIEGRRRQARRQRSHRHGTDHIHIKLADRDA